METFTAAAIIKLVFDAVIETGTGKFTEAVLVKCKIEADTVNF